MNTMLAHLASATLEAPKVLPRGAKRNKNAGHGYERDVRDVYRAIGFAFLNTARKESRSRDNQQIDLVNENEDQNGRFPYNVQCKSVTGLVDYHAILSGAEKKTKVRRGPLKGQSIKKFIPGIPKVPGVINVILHKFTVPEVRIDGLNNTEKTEFVAKGYYAILVQDDWFQIVKERIELIELRKRVKDLESELAKLKQNDSII